MDAPLLPRGGNAFTHVYQCGFSVHAMALSSISLRYFPDKFVSSASLPHLPVRTCRCNYAGSLVLKCGIGAKKESASEKLDALIKEPHKYFDQVFITVRSGDGGQGAVLRPDTREIPKPGRKGGNTKKKLRLPGKRDFDGTLILPVGGHGGDIVIYVDEGMDTLLEYHKESKFRAKRGGSVNSMGILAPNLHDGLPALPLRIPVPVGTVVKHKRGKLFADLAKPGDEVVVAKGGHGGVSLLEMPKNNLRIATKLTNVLKDERDRDLVLGKPGEEVTLNLILRVVADIGLVGLPNAGKSTLLAAVTVATPRIADYPFTTLIPNLGCIDGDPSLGAGFYSSRATLADMPGLIEGAHLGKGLGRNFLRHLRRTRLLVHVVDAAADDPVKDYITVREELRMYNPDYLLRPYIVVLNKIDLPQVSSRLPSLIEEIERIGSGNHQHALQSLDGANMVISEDEVKQMEQCPSPLSVVAVSVLKGIKVDEMLGEIREGLRKC